MLIETREAAGPAKSMLVAEVRAREAAVIQQQLSMAAHGHELDLDDRLVTAHAVFFPGPGEGESARRHDLAIDAAHRVLAHRAAHAGAPFSADAEVDLAHRALHALRPPPLREELG